MWAPSGFCSQSFGVRVLWEGHRKNQYPSSMGTADFLLGRAWSNNSVSPKGGPLLHPYLCQCLIYSAGRLQQASRLPGCSAYCFLHKKHVHGDTHIHTHT